MKKKSWLSIGLAGLLAGAVTGLLGAGGGMILVPILTRFTDLEESQVFPASVSIILPICIISLFLTQPGENIRYYDLIPYLLGSAVGGVAAGLWGQKIPVKWLHRVLGILIIWGGIRSFC